MILRNEKQYEFAKIQLAKLEAAQRTAPADADVPAVARRAHCNGVALLVGDLRAQIAEYEALRAGKIKSLALDSVLAQLPATLVQARIARGWTQRQLAQELGTSEQQVQKDEAGAYARASLEKLGRVAGVLGVTLSGRAQFTCANSAPKTRATKRAASTRSKLHRENETSAA